MTFADINAIYSIIGIGNRMMVMELKPDGSIAEFWDFEHFKKKLIKEVTRFQQDDGKIKIMPLAEVWLHHPRGRQYEKLVYAMPGALEQAGPRDYNGWQGFSVQPKAGNWELNRAHLIEVICSNDQEAYRWVMNWLAALVQLPGRHAWTALVLRGGQGIGKGHFADRMIGRLFGPQQYIHILGSGQLTAEFNEHLSGKVLIFADESTWGGDPRAASKLKGMITEDRVTINRKFLKMVDEPSHLHTMIASNNSWPIPIEHDDRRFTVLDVSEAKKQDQAYFGRLLAELDNGGLAALLDELLSINVNQSMLRIPLMNAAKAQVAINTMKPIERWWLELLERGTIGDGEWPDKILKQDLHRSYINFLDYHYRHSREARSTETELGFFLRKFTPAQQQRLRRDGRIERVVFLPCLAECRETWITALGWRPNYPWDGGALDAVSDELVGQASVDFPDEM